MTESSNFLFLFPLLYPEIVDCNWNSPTGTILAILYGEVPHMLPAIYQPNPPGGSGEEDF